MAKSLIHPIHPVAIHGVPGNSQFSWKWPCNSNLPGEDKCQSFWEPSPQGEELFGPGKWMRQLWFTARATSLPLSEAGRSGKRMKIQLLVWAEKYWPVVNYGPQGSSHLKPRGRRHRGLWTWASEAEGRAEEGAAKGRQLDGWSHPLP